METKKGKNTMDKFKFSKPFYLLVAGLVSVAMIASYFIFAAVPVQEAQEEIPAIAGEYVPDHVLVRFKAGTSKEKEKEIKDKNGLEQKDEIPQIETKILKIKDKGNVAAKIKALSKNLHILYAEPDYMAEGRALCQTILIIQNKTVT
jgi:thermitase